MMNRFALLLLGCSNFIVPQASAPAPIDTAALHALAGCYRLTTEWLDTPADFGGLVPLPSVVHLDTLQQHSAGRTPDFHAGPAITPQHELPSEPGWHPVGRDSLVVSWWDGFTGPTVELGRAKSGWRGIATFSDDIHTTPGPRMRVTAVRVKCP